MTSHGRWEREEWDREGWKREEWDREGHSVWRHVVVAYSKCNAHDFSWQVGERGVGQRGEGQREVGERGALDLEARGRGLLKVQRARLLMAGGRERSGTERGGTVRGGRERGT
jgi:hypothetical protein